MNKKIKQINMTFENCESVVIPNVCIKKLDYKLDKKDNIINLDCIIENDGSICSNPFDNKSPIQRINEYDDITSIDIIYTDNSSNNYCVSWYDDGYYHIQSSNKNQYSKILRYNKIHIIIEPFIPTYKINEIFDLPIGTIIQGEDQNKYTIYSFKNNSKRTDIPMDMEHITMKYIVSKLGEKEAT